MAHISLMLVGLMWVIPFLHYRHQHPLTTFHQEWWSALLGVLALTLLATRSFWRQPEIPRIVQLPAGLILVAALQGFLGKITYFDQALLYILYLLFAALLMMLGARLRDSFGMEKLSLVLAVFLLAGVELNALIGLLQHYRWRTPLDHVVIMKVSSGVYGNLAQPNHFANYIALGLASLGLLYQRQRLRAAYVAMLSVPLLFVMTLSGSRSSWLYLLMMAALAWWGARRDAGQRPLLRYALLLAAGFGAMHLIVQLPFMVGANNSTDTVQRLLASGAGDTSGSIRLFLWREAALIFSQSPWLGAGFGQFAWQHFQLQPLLFQSNVVGLYNNAHNLILQLAAEAGIAGVLALLVPLGIWLHGLRNATLDAPRWWGLAILGVLAIHSLLEYPLWYVYFLAVASFLLGALDETRYRPELRHAGHASMALILSMGFLTLMQLSAGHRQLEQALDIRPASSAGEGESKPMRDNLLALYDRPLLPPYAELHLSALIEVNGERLDEKLALNTRVMHFVPIATVTYRQALLLAQSGQPTQAKTIMEQAIWSYPGDFNTTRRQLADLAQKDPAHFSALLEFALQKEQEYQRAVHHQ